MLQIDYEELFVHADMEYEKSAVRYIDHKSN